MQVIQHKFPLTHCQISSHPPYESQQMLTTMSNRIHQPLVFSVDDRLLEQNLTRLDLCSKHLHRIDKLPNNINFNIILLDQNEISKIENLDNFPQLIQLSASHNRLVDIRLLNRLRSLQKLNLSYNLIDSIDCLKNLQNLTMLNISNNNIHSIAALSTCHALQSLDASENAIQQIEDLSHLTSLKYLNLHKNFIDTLVSIPRHWPKSLHTLVISDNEIQDLTEISYLTSFIDLNTLYIADNPCLSVIDERYGCHQPFDYRPYILNWCLSIHNLDGIFITRKESLKAEWLLSQGKGRSFRPGDHIELVQYLTRVCGTDPDQRDDLHLSRIMLQKDLYNQHRQSVDDQMLATSDTMRDANETLSKTAQAKSQQSTIISESEFLKLTSSVSTADVHLVSTHQQQMRTPSPGFSRPTSVNTNYIDEQITDNSSSKRYTNYDNRPIKPLDKDMLQTKLNEYPVNNNTNSNAKSFHSKTSSNTPQAKRISPHLVYNANRYSPKITRIGPTASSALHTTSNRNIVRQRHNRVKRQTTNSSHTNALRALNHSLEESVHCLTTIAKVKIKEQQPSKSTSNANKNQRINDDDDDEIQLKSAPVIGMLSTQSITMNNNVEIQRLTESVETMRTSILQAYLNLHERFTKTTELQTSALAALWKKCETQTSTHQRETEKLRQENRLLHQRIHELEGRLNTNDTKLTDESLNSSMKPNSNLYPPLRAHISKRDTKSFYLHWIPNPLNEHRGILGYRIYIDDTLKGAIDPGRFEAIIDYIRDEGEYKIKLRTYNEHGESSDSNIVIARFRRQHSLTTNYRTQSNRALDDNYERQINENFIISPREQDENTISVTPEKKMTKSNEQISPFKISPHPTANDNNIITLKPPKSPSSSPGRTDKTSPNSNRSCSKVLFDHTNNSDASTTVITTKRSPTRIGIMSRLAKSPHRLQRNHILTNHSPVELNNNPTDVLPATTTTERVVAFQPDISNSIIPDAPSSNSSSPPPPIPPQYQNVSMIKSDPPSSNNFDRPKLLLFKFLAHQIHPFAYAVNTFLQPALDECIVLMHSNPQDTFNVLLSLSQTFTRFAPESELIYDDIQQFAIQLKDAIDQCFTWLDPNTIRQTSQLLESAHRSLLAIIEQKHVESTTYTDMYKNMSAVLTNLEKINSLPMEMQSISIDKLVTGQQPIKQEPKRDVIERTDPFFPNGHSNRNINSLPNRTPMITPPPGMLPKQIEKPTIGLPPPQMTAQPESYISSQNSISSSYQNEYEIIDTNKQPIKKPVAAVASFPPRQNASLFTSINSTHEKPTTTSKPDIANDHGSSTLLNKATKNDHTSFQPKFNINIKHDIINHQQERDTPISICFSERSASLNNTLGSPRTLVTPAISSSHENQDYATNGQYYPNSHFSGSTSSNTKLHIDQTKIQTPLYITDEYIQEFGNKQNRPILRGELYMTYGKPQSGPQATCLPIGVGLSYDEQTLFSCDVHRSAQTVRLFDIQTGLLKHTISSNQQMKFHRPGAVMSNSRNNILIVERDSIYITEPDGRLIQTLSHRSIKQLYGIALYRDRYILTIDSKGIDNQSAENCRVLLFDPSSGQLVCEQNISINRQPENILRQQYMNNIQGRVLPETTSKPRFIAVHNDDIYIADLGRSLIYGTKLRNQFELTATSVFGGQGRANGEMIDPSGLFIDSGGNIISADSKNDRIQLFASDGAYKTTFKLNERIKRPSGICANRAGTQFYVSCYLAGCVRAFDIEY
ncbi:unnamed protein product [Rotaria socialis]|uniref:Centrosomal protein of 97 kDa n=1 Tax=Rotaria socialis TaxID=392032 RepID=A0A820FNK1_9BILA|nr:unnamed protein product [Rotaria socialis]CAF4447697.1 unnamed protein product [Rotaria socialis]